jgi:hypothetical protein
LAQQAVSEARESGDAIKIAKAEGLLDAVTTPTKRVASAPCPPGAGLVGAKLDLPPGSDDFETSPVLMPCVYSGQFDVEESQPKHYKVALKVEQTLTVVIRTRGVDSKSISISLHGPDGGLLNGRKVWGDNAVIRLPEYKAEQIGAAHVKLSGGVRGSALDISVR